MIKQQISETNKTWFDRKGSFNFLKVNAEAQFRITRILKLLAEEIKTQDRPYNLLDIGCGSGEISKQIANLGFRVYGIDISRRAIKTAKNRGIIAIVGDITNIFPFKDGFFDYVFAGEVIEHLFDVRHFLLETNRVLKPDGKLLLTTPNLANLSDRIRLLIGENPRQVTPVHKFLHLHIRPFTFKSLRRTFDLYHFKIIRFTSTLVIFKRQEDDIVLKSSKLLAELFPSLGETLIVKAIKLKNLSMLY